MVNILQRTFEMKRKAHSTPDLGNKRVTRSASAIESAEAVAGRALPLIAVEGDRFVFTEEAREFLAQIHEPCAVVAVAGKYRTGKSYLLNRVLLGLSSEEQGFGVGGTIQACTKGLWIYDQPVRAEDGKLVLIVDSEGIGAFNATDTHDSRIFALALLISSYFIYNSVGTIDESAISTLSLVANLSKCVRASAEDIELSEEESAKELGKHFPNFLWLVRDFGLDLVTPEGRRMTAQQYLESALASPEAADTSNAEKSRIRSLLRAYFPERDCETLVRPCNDETQLRNLDHADESALRNEFREQARALREKVLQEAPVKRTLGEALTGGMLAALCDSYVDAMNAGACPAIRDSWSLLVEARAQQALNYAMQCYALEVESIELPIPQEQLEGALEILAKNAKALFAKGCIEPCSDAELSRRIEIEAQRLRADNDAALERSIWTHVRELEAIAFLEIVPAIREQQSRLRKEWGERILALWAPLVLEHLCNRIQREQALIREAIAKAHDEANKAEQSAAEAARKLVGVEERLHAAQVELEESNAALNVAREGYEKRMQAEVSAANERAEAISAEKQEIALELEGALERLAGAEDALAKLEAKQALDESTLNARLAELEEMECAQSGELEALRDKCAEYEHGSRENEAQTLQIQELEAHNERMREELVEKETEFQERLEEHTAQSRAFLDEIRRNAAQERHAHEEALVAAQSELEQTRATLERTVEEAKHREARIIGELEQSDKRSKAEIAQLERALEAQRKTQSESREELRQLRAHNEAHLSALRESHLQELREKEERWREELKSAQKRAIDLQRELQSLERRVGVAELRAETQGSRVTELESQLKEEKKRQQSDRSALDLAHVRGKLQVLEESNFELKRKTADAEKARVELERKLRQKERDFEMEKLRLEMDFELRASRGAGGKK